MDYDRAKKLKNAGFPQRKGIDGTNTSAQIKYGFPIYVCEHGNQCEDTRWCPSSVFYPTLSELIAACGNDFFRLESMMEGWECRGRNVQNSYGSTPEEAVANLWLELNKK
jgi:hypothetical protein